MKKYKTIILMCIFTTLGIIIGRYTSKNDVYEQDTIKIKNNNTISMMLETDTNSKTYIQSTSSTWPSDGYVFNEEMSKCEQGSKLSWDDTNKKVVMEGNTSDKCYVFFDKYSPIKINNSSITSSGNKITITIDATSGTGTISKYYYSKDDGVTYTSSTSNTYTFTSLDKGTYKIKAYVEDSNEKKSEIISKTIEVTIVSLAQYVTSQYTGIQGENGLYYHDSTLTNGAYDNSYRYAGADPNNYVCFGSTATTCPTNNLYRIVGVFGSAVHGLSNQNLVKLIKYEYATTTELGTDGDYNNNYGSTSNKSDYYKGSLDLTTVGAYHWNYKNTDSNNSGMGLNTWSSSLLNTTNLNTNYLNNIGTTWSNKIETVSWIVGGNSDYSIAKKSPSDLYKNEITAPIRNDKVTAKIGLMYVSDYAFAAEPSAWTTTLDSYSAATITAVNWMYMGLIEWTMTRNSASTSYINVLQITGYIWGNGGAMISYARDAIALRQTFYLKSSVNYASGTGSKSDPIRLS